MRELFDEVAGQSPLDPEEAVRRTTRVPQRKRFYASAGVAEAEGGFAVTLDGKPIRTPSGRQVVVPNREIAEAIAAEWNAQGETIDPLTMPLTRFANSVGAERWSIASRRSPTTSQNISARICCSIAPAIPKRWSPGKPRIGTRSCSGRRTSSARISFSPRGSCMSPSRSPRSRRRARRFPADPWSIAALHVVTTLTGSALLALALCHGVRSADEVWAAAHVDEDWNIEKWGVDEEVAARRAARLVDFTAAVTILKALKP